MTKLTLFFSGTDMAWEDTALFLQLGAKKRHNLRENSAPHYYYFFDGPAASSSPEHPPVEYLEFDETKENFTTAKPRKNYSYIQHFYDLGHGSGMDHTIRVAFKIIQLAIKKGITEFDFVGFSRGGSMALAEGALINQLEQTDLPKELVSKIQVNIIAIDPVAGLSRNKSANIYGEISPLVKTCIVGLATNESLPGFEPRNILANMNAYNIKFHPSTQYIFLPFPEDHLMTHIWMQDIVKRHLPSGSDLLSTCDERWLIERRLGLTHLKWFDTFGETAAYRMVKYVEEKNAKKSESLYHRSIFPADEKQSVNLQQGIEEFFKYLTTLHASVNVGHNSLQNDADSEVKHRYYKKANGETVKIGHAHPEFKHVQMFFAKFYDRAVKQKLHLYTNRLFVNLLHESMFQKAYPDLHELLTSWKLSYLASAIKQYESITLPSTKEHIKQALIDGVKLKSIDKLKSTNIQNLNSIFKMVSNIPDSEHKAENKLENSDSPTSKPSEMEIHCFANVVIHAGDTNAAWFIETYQSKYLADLESWEILYRAFKNHQKTLPEVLENFVRYSYYQ